MEKKLKKQIISRHCENKYIINKSWNKYMKIKKEISLNMELLLNTFKHH